MQIIIGCLFIVFLVFLSFGVELKDAAKYTLVLTLVIIGIVGWWLESQDSMFVFAIKVILLAVVILFVYLLFSV